uniref:Uncharacterized protein n=1 Tax=viral metagenome TaxID=1070528 RepID=A0A6C0HGE2_9ZZZZ
MLHDSIDSDDIIERIISLSGQFNRHQATHPTLSKLWVDALDECKRKLCYIKQTVEQGELLIEKLPNNVNDPSISTIITLISMMGGFGQIDDTMTSTSVEAGQIINDYESPMTYESSMTHGGQAHGGQGAEPPNDN